MTARLCGQCRTRWAQHAGGWCRYCFRRADIDEIRTGGQHAPAMLPRLSHTVAPREHRIVTVEDLSFEVMFDGT